MNVLVVEDEPKLRHTLGEMLRAIGHAASLSSTAGEALRAVRDRSPDALLLDLRLPGMDGLDLLEKVRESHPALPTVILTGFGDLPAAQRAIRLGVKAFLTKPCRIGELEAALSPIGAPPRGVAVSPWAGMSDAASCAPVPDARTLDEVEEARIQEALERHAGHRGAAAAELGISLRTLYYRLRKLRDDA